MNKYSKIKFKFNLRRIFQIFEYKHLIMNAEFSIFVECQN